MKSALKKRDSILKLKISINDEFNEKHPSYFTLDEINHLLSLKLIGLSTDGMAIRTRSKFLKTEVCKALGHAIPKSFKKQIPRFKFQNFDIIGQKSNNLQIWNDELSETRRYGIVEVDENQLIKSVKVVTGSDLKKLSATGNRTKKFQAMVPKDLGDLPLLFTAKDSKNLTEHLSDQSRSLIQSERPSEPPTSNNLIPIEILFEKFAQIVGHRFSAMNSNQERNRGALLHAQICKILGFLEFSDNGQFPDILNQLLEVKLQTSPTIDLGSVLPTSTGQLLKIGRTTISHCDVRYAVFFGKKSGKMIEITSFALGIGADFFKIFSQCQGKIVNKKIQIPLPKNFFSKN